jgi:GT2 family glycosyltransferase
MGIVKSKAFLVATVLFIIVVAVLCANVLKSNKLRERVRNAAAVQEEKKILQERLNNVTLGPKRAPMLACKEHAPCDFHTVHKENEAPGFYYNYYSSHANANDVIQPVPVLSTTVSYSSQWIRRLVASIDHPVAHLVIVHDVSKSALINANVTKAIDETLFQYRNRWGNGSSVKIIRHSPSRGCAAGFNEGLRRATPQRIFRAGYKRARAHFCVDQRGECPNEPAPWALILNDDVAFRPGDLARLSQGMHAHALNMPEAQHGFVTFKYTFTDRGTARSWVARPPFCAFAVTATTLEQVGLFDENFWPAYKEDNEYCIRLERIGINCIESDVIDNGVRLIHGDPSALEYLPGSTGTVGAQASRIIGETCGKRYIKRKWGALTHIPPTRLPYNQMSGNLFDWRLDKRRIERMVASKGVLEKCMGVKSPESCTDSALGKSVC